MLSTAFRIEGTEAELRVLDLQREQSCQCGRGATLACAEALAQGWLHDQGSGAVHTVEVGSERCPSRLCDVDEHHRAVGS